VGAVHAFLSSNNAAVAVFGKAYLWPSPMRSACLLPLFICMVAGAQDRILLMNGQTIKGRVLGQSSLEVRYQIPKGARLIERSEPTESVFSVTDSLGHERVWYFMDTVFGNDYSVDQMRWIIKGEQDARDGYRPLLPMLGGFAFGMAPVVALDLEVMSLLLPPIYAGLMALPRVHVTKGSIRDPLMDGDPYYATGYASVGRSKRILRTLYATAAGVAAGLALRQLVINPALSP